MSAPANAAPANAIVESPPDDRSPLAIAYGWAIRVMTISAEMVLPGLVGVWLDAEEQLGTRFVFTLIGFAIGLPLALWHLLRMTKAIQNDRLNRDGGSNNGTVSS